MKNLFKPTILSILFVGVLFIIEIRSQNTYINNSTFVLDNSLTNKTSDFEKYKLFVIGERHGQKINTDIYIHLIEYFNENYGVKHIILEEGYARVALMNLYINDGNFKAYDILEQYSLKSEMIIVNWVKSYNASVSDNMKLILHGVDYEQTAEGVLFINLLMLLLPENDPPHEILPVIQELREFNLLGLYSYKDCNKLYLKLLSSFQEYEKYYENFLGTNYLNFKNAIVRLNKSIELQTFNYNIKYDSIKTLQREVLIAKNILELTKKFPNQKFLAKYGVHHIGLVNFLSEKDNCNSFVGLLRQNDNFGSNGVASFYIHYNKLCVEKRFFKKNYGKRLFNEIKDVNSNGDFVIIRLNGNQSPYLEISENKFQYIITY